MTLRDIILKNFKYNLKKYWAYFLCCCFNVMVLTMYSTFFFNPQVTSAVEKTPISSILKTFLAVLSIFCFCFISYVNSSFIRGRNSEFGLLLTLGLSRKDMEKIIGTENLILSLSSLVLGLLCGLILSRLFFMVGINLLGFTNIGFNISLNSILFTFGVFIIINSFLWVKRKLIVRKISLTDLISSSKVSSEMKTSSLLGFIGIIIIIVSYFLMDYAFKHSLGTPWHCTHVVLMFIGLFMVISNFGDLLIKFNKKFYFNNIISLSSIKYRFRSCRNIIYSLSLLTSLVVFFIALTLSYYSHGTELTDKQTPYDIGYSQVGSMNNLNDKSLMDIINTESDYLDESHSFNYLLSPMHTDVYLHDSFSLWSRNQVIISESTAASNLSSQNLSLDKLSSDECVIIRLNKETKPWSTSDDSIKLTSRDEKKEIIYSIREEIYDVVGNASRSRTFRNRLIIILSDSAYEELIRNFDIKESKLNLFNFTDDGATERVFRALISAELGIDSSTERLFRYHYNRDIKVSSYLVEKNSFYTIFSFNFFLIGLIGVLFFISSGAMIYFKVYSDIDESKERYNMLYRTGITEKEIRSSLSKEILPLFIFPALIGGIISIGYISVMFINLSLYLDIILTALEFLTFYLLLMFIFFTITRKNYVRNILVHLNI